MTTPFGYLLVHFVEDHVGHGEQIYFSLSDGDDALRWTRMNGGQAILSSALGTTGVRDPHLVRGDAEFFLIATDLRVQHGDGRGWDAWSRHGSRSIVVWRSTDLIEWGTPWLAQISPETAGMTWAPESTFDPATGEYLVYWSSNLFEPSDPDHTGPTYSRILASRTRDFITFSQAEVLVDLGPDAGVIDMTVAADGTTFTRFLKSEATSTVFQQVGGGWSDTDFRTVATGIAADRFEQVEAPLVFRDHAHERWYLWVDQYGRWPQGYVALASDSLGSGGWQFVDDSFELPESTKHGVVLPLLGDEWHRIRAAYPA